VFVAGFRRVIDVPMYGFYALDEDGGAIDHNVGDVSVAGMSE
jgi:hypothetical protein